MINCKYINTKFCEQCFKDNINCKYIIFEQRKREKLNAKLTKNNVKNINDK